MMQRARPWRGWRSRRSDHAQRPVSSPACNIISINRTIILANTPSRALEAYSTARASVLNVFLPSRARALDVLHASRARVDQRFPHISRARPQRSPCIPRTRCSMFSSRLARTPSTSAVHLRAHPTVPSQLARPRSTLSIHPAQVSPVLRTGNISGGRTIPRSLVLREEDPGGSID